MRFQGFKLIGRIGNTYYFAQSVFEHGSDFQGVTGCIICPVSQDEYDDATSRESVEDYFWCHANDYETRAGFDNFIDDIMDSDEAGSYVFDDSYCYDAEDAFNELGVAYACTNCVGGGRIFMNHVDFDECYDETAYMAIRAIEDSSGDIKVAAKILGFSA